MAAYKVESRLWFIIISHAPMYFRVLLAVYKGLALVHRYLTGFYIFQGILGSVQSGKSALVHHYLTGFYIFQGILGSVQSGKSALVHRYLTGSYMQEESPEGITHDFPKFSDNRKLCCNPT